ncbi:sulfofructose kinase [mine drainage metagenome]|uniref:Sulfofructose kinase n=1 Tax=mine drainage metagenome TaxID=410659 RepID=A0A1J5R9Y6_9ZZZZ
MSRILLVGTATLDLVFELDHHPAADEEMRARALRTCRGGNAANTAVVLAGLGHAAEFLGVLADAPETAVIEQDLARHGVSFQHCQRLPGRAPTSSIYLAGARRSIVHYRDLPELAADRFSSVELGCYDWLHFEGRNVEQLALMMAHARGTVPGLPVSLELEKARDGIESLFGGARLLLCSRGFAQHYGFDHPQDFLAWMQERAPQADVVVAWGESGAFAVNGQTPICHAPAQPSLMVCDTLGAGDTFNAVVISARLQQLSLPGALEHACGLAGRKCGVYGFDF